MSNTAFYSCIFSRLSIDFEPSLTRTSRHATAFFACSTSTHFRHIALVKFWKTLLLRVPLHLRVSQRRANTFRKTVLVIQLLTLCFA